MNDKNTQSKDQQTKDDCLYVDRWDSLIRFWAQALGMNWHLIKAVVRKESEFKSRAVSPCGACGLMQLMPATAAEINPRLRERPELIFDPELNLHAGIFYLRDQIRRFPEISNLTERIKFALGAYNAGRGNINKMIELCRKDTDTQWRIWDRAKMYLVFVTGEHAHETIDYVDTVMIYWTENQLREKAEVAEIVDAVNKTKNVKREA